MAALIKPLPDGVPHGFLGKPRSERVYRHYPACDAVDGAFQLVDGIGHGALCAGKCYPAVKYIALARFYLIFDVALIKICYVNRTAVVHGPEFHKLKPPADAGEPGSVGYHGVNAHSFVRQGQGDGLILAAVLVFSWKKADKIAERGYAQPFERLGFLFANALYISYVRVKISHIYLAIIKRHGRSISIWPA